MSVDDMRGAFEAYEASTDPDDDTITTVRERAIGEARTLRNRAPDELITAFGERAPGSPRGPSLTRWIALGLLALAVMALGWWLMGELM